MTEQTPPEMAHVVEEKPTWSSAPRSVDQTTSPVGDCPVTVAVHLVCESAGRGLVWEPPGEQITVMLVDWAVASRAGIRMSTSEEPLRSKTITRTNNRTFVCLGPTMARLCSADIGMT